MNIVFMGTPEFSVNVLKAIASKYDVKLVVSQPNREKKKGVLLDTPVARTAKELGLKLIQPENIKEAYDEILNAGADILVSAAYGQYIPTKILKIFKSRINVHASLLPKHRGGAPIQRCLIEGDKETGVTIMEMAKGLDTGVMYSQAKYEIQPDDNSTTLFEKLSIIGTDLLMDSIEDIVSGKNSGVAQDEALSTYSANIAPEEERINLNKKSEEIVNQIRGLSMEPGAYLMVGDIKLKVFKASIIADDTNCAPGTVLSVKKGIKIKTLDNAI